MASPSKSSSAKNESPTEEFGFTSAGAAGCAAAAVAGGCAADAGGGGGAVTAGGGGCAVTAAIAVLLAVLAVTALPGINVMDDCAEHVRFYG